jgi:hypothetical protein
MWAENLGWINLSCKNLSSCGTLDYGVKNDGAGNLSGYAWAENAGWIDFAPLAAGVSVDPGTAARGTSAAGPGARTSGGSASDRPARTRTR